MKWAFDVARHCAVGQNPVKTTWTVKLSRVESAETVNTPDLNAPPDGPPFWSTILNRRRNGRVVDGGLERRLGCPPNVISTCSRSGYIYATSPSFQSTLITESPEFHP